MPRDLFAGTFTHRQTPPRSKWTIAGSFVAHVALVAALLVIPVLSALDNYVVQAHNVTFVVPPAPVMPAIPAPPPPKTTAPIVDADPSKAPVTAPDRVTPEADRVSVPVGPPAPPGIFDSIIGKGPVIPGGTSNKPPIETAPPIKQKPLPVGGD